MMGLLLGSARLDPARGRGRVELVGDGVGGKDGRVLPMVLVARVML